MDHPVTTGRSPRRGKDKKRADGSGSRGSGDRIRDLDQIAGEEQYRAISEVVSDWAYALTIEADGRPISEWTSLNVQRISGYTPAELAEREGWLTLAHPDDLPIVRAHLDALMAGATDIVEYRIVTKSGETRWLRDYARPLGVSGKGSVAVVGGVRDITARRQAELDRARLMAELEATHEELERLTQSVTTDLKEPLSSLDDSLDGLERDLSRGDRESARADVERTRQAASRLRELLDALLGRAPEASGLATGR
jgi:PAS domain S-box-containing protein